MSLNLSAVISLLALLFYSVLLIIIMRLDVRSRLNRTFGLYLLSMIIWSLGSFMIFLDSQFMTTLFWNRFMVIGSMGMPVAFFGFAQKFLMKERRFWLNLGYLLYLVIQIANAMGLIITDAFVKDGLLYNQYGPGIAISSVSWAFFVVFLAFDLYKEYRKAEDVFYRNRIKYLLVITTLTFTGSLTNITQLAVFPVDIAFNAVSALLIAYAIIRHRLLDISLVVRKGMLYSIPTVIIGAGYFLIISMALNIFHAASGLSLFILSLIVAVVAAVVTQPIQDKAQGWIDKIFFREKYDSSVMLQRVSSTAASMLDLEKLINLIVDEITSTLMVDKTAFFLDQAGDGDFTLVAQRGGDKHSTTSLKSSHPLIRWLEANNRVLLAHELDVLPQFKALWEQEVNAIEDLAADLFLPLKVDNELVGVLALGSKLSGEAYSRDDELTLATLANQTAVAIGKARLFYKLQQLAITDDLTGIFNRRHLFDLGIREFNRATRFNRSLSVIMMDLDHFKLVNDTYGHSVGDEVLRIIAQRCQNGVRNVDVLGRYGGEEFVVVLPETEWTEALQITERLCNTIADIPVKTSVGPLSVTASFGVAGYRPDDDSFETFLERADNALYFAKQDGRNRYQAYDLIRTMIDDEASHAE